MGNVVEFPVRLPEADVFAHAELARVYAAWRQTRHDDGLPLLRDFAPRRLGALMAWSAIADTAAQSPDELAQGAVVRWRLAGSALCRLADAELTHRPVFEGWARFEQATLLRLLGQGLFRGQAFLARLRLAAVAGSADGRLEMLALPLRDAARGRDVVLVVFMPFFDMNSIVVADFTSARLESLRTLLTDGAAPATGAVRGGEQTEAKVLPLFGASA